MSDEDTKGDKLAGSVTLTSQAEQFYLP